MKRKLSAQERLIVALDATEIEAALALARKLKGVVQTLKVGSILYTAYGPRVIQRLQKMGFQIMLDLKFYDIPSTVEGSCVSAANLNVSLLTVHASGGTMMLKGAVRGARRQAKVLGLTAPKVLAVTVLTSEGSLDPAALKQQILKLAHCAQDAGCAGIVCSAQEAEMVRQTLGDKFIILCPGIRPASSQTNDQKRTATPAQAIQQGADYLVIGRPITQAKDPRAAAKTILEEMETIE